MLGSNNTVAGKAVVPRGFQPLQSGNSSSNGSAAVLPTTEVRLTRQHDALAGSSLWPIAMSASSYKAT